MNRKDTRNPTKVSPEGQDVCPPDTEKARRGNRRVALGAVMAVIALSGCATADYQANSDPPRYNPVSGYPVVGGTGWHN
jgi:hypothetical protein